MYHVTRAKSKVLYPDLPRLFSPALEISSASDGASASVSSPANGEMRLLLGYV